MVTDAQNANSRLRAGIIETANALGMNPADLATIISYETAGTFDPRKKGPTTQWGQHEGLIQFGQPQQRDYGVDLSSTDAALSSQLGADGAIARYFRGNGWEPGMGLLQAYSIVNAGGPNRFNRSDANNGGAPGTVADKVRDQMGGHARNAANLLGGSYQPTFSGGPTSAPSAASAVGSGFTAEQISAAFRKAEPQQQVQVQEAQPQAPVIQHQPREGYTNNTDVLAMHMQALANLQNKRKGLLYGR